MVEVVKQNRLMALGGSFRGIECSRKHFREESGGKAVLSVDGTFDSDLLDSSTFLCKQIVPVAKIELVKCLFTVESVLTVQCTVLHNCNRLLQGLYSAVFTCTFVQFSAS